MITDLASFDWKDPDYAEVFNARIDVLQRLRKEPSLIPALKAYYRDNIPDFISDWGVTFDPRNAERGLPTLIPFILFPRQREWVEWVIRHWRAQTPGLCEKSRDMGVSWLATCTASSLCLFYEGLAIGFGSRKEEYVDKIGTMKPLLPKARVFLEHLPEEFRGGWDPMRDAPYMRINFPESGSIIMGEAGDQIGRGDRASIYMVDEAQPLDAKVVTPHGVRKMGDIRPGMIVCGGDGRPTKVRQVKDCGAHDVLRITFSDGTSVECSPNHLWKVKKVLGLRETKIMRAHEIAETYRYESPGGQVQYRYQIPVCGSVAFDGAVDLPLLAPSNLPLDPYLVGALLGDGHIVGNREAIRLTSADAEIVESFDRLLPIGVIVGAYDGRFSYGIVDADNRRGRIKGGGYVRSRAKIAVAAAGIMGWRGPDKFVPDLYKFSTPANRLSVLQGLMDTDGYALPGAASFHTSSIKLANDVRFIAQSLGGTAIINIKPDARGYRDQYAVSVALPKSINPFRLSRKANKFGARKHPPHRTIISVSHVGRRPVRCITVSARDGLYLTDGFVVTHNSAYLERPELVEHSLSQTTNCRIDMSSVNGMNNPFAKKRHSGKVDVFIFDWRDDPRKDQEWYDRLSLGEDEGGRGLDPVTIAQEVDRDYSASVEGIVIPGAWVRAAIDAKEKLGIAPSGVRRMSLDVADAGRDKNAACGAEGTEVAVLEEWSGKGSDIFETVERAFLLCDEHKFPGFRYDADGLGAGVRGDARRINDRRRTERLRQIEVVPFRGSDAVLNPDAQVFPGDSDRPSRTNKDYFANRKAQMWWSLRGRFQKTYRWVMENRPCAPDDIISIPSSLKLTQKLVTELSQPTFKINNVGKILIDKVPDGMASPNLADALMMNFADIDRSALNITPELVAAVRSMGARRRF